jgi:surfactin synthase thioesterase subunit
LGAITPVRTIVKALLRALIRLRFPSGVVEVRKEFIKRMRPIDNKLHPDQTAVTHLFAEYVPAWANMIFLEWYFHVLQALKARTTPVDVVIGEHDHWAPMTGLFADELFGMSTAHYYTEMWDGGHFLPESNVAECVQLIRKTITQ